MIASALSSMMPGCRMSEDPSRDPTSDFWYYPVGQVSTTGVRITSDMAMRISAVFGCIRVLRDALGWLPFKVYRKTGPKSKEPDYGNYLYSLLHDHPNSWQTPQEWKELAILHLCLRGNFYCQIFGKEERTELLPLHPDRMEVKQLANRTLRYYYRPPNAEPIDFRDEQIFHIRGLSLDGLVGTSVLDFARNSIGLASAQETHGAALFKNGGLPTFWISRPPERKWTPTARQNFREEWRGLHGGPENAGQPPILGDGMELHELGLTNRDSQWIESRGLSAEEICRFFGVHPHMIGVKTSAPIGTIEQQSLEFVLYTLGPLATRFEQAADRDLVDDPETTFTKISLDALLRGDLKSRYEAHNIAVQGGWKLINEVRELEDLNPIEGGDEPRFPMNMQPAGGGPDQNEQGGRPGKGQPKPAEQQDDEPTAYERRRQKKQDAQAAFAILLDEAAVRIARAEIAGLETRAHKASEDFARWRTFATGFYGKHQAYVLKTLDPICAAWLTQTDEKREPGRLADCVVAPVGSIFDAQVDQVANIEAWKMERAGDLARILKEEFFG
jgi:HK97 family phage portal protein